MKIAIVHSFYSSDAPSGENTVVLDQVEELTARGHEVTLIAEHTDRRRNERLFSLKSAANVVVGRGRSPDVILRSFGPDVVHLHNVFPNWGTSWLREWGHRTVMTLHNYRSVCANGLLFRDGKKCVDCCSRPVVPALTHRCYRDSRVATLPLALGSSPMGALRAAPRLCSQLVVLNAEAQELLSASLGRDCVVVPNFVRDVSGDSPVVPVDAPWVFVGRLSEEKGLGSLLKGWPSGKRLHIYGDGPLRVSLEAAFASPDVRFFGSVSRGDLRQRLRQYSGLLIPSECRENLPTALLEALEASLPVLLSRNVAVADFVRLRGAGLVLDGSENNLIDSLREVESGALDLRTAARALWRGEYSPDAWAARTEAIYAQVRRASP